MHVLHFRDGTTAEYSAAPTIDTDRQLVLLGGEHSSEVAFTELKAVFFLVDEPRMKVADGPTTAGSFLAVEFLDGELIRGYARYNPASPGFFLYPAEKGRNERVFVVTGAVQSIEIEKV
jgi:hypothetical protein